MLSDAPCSATIAVRDLERAKAFYGDTLGLKHAGDNPGGASYMAGNTRVELIMSEFAGTAKNTVAAFEVAAIIHIAAARANRRRCSPIWTR